MEQGPGIRDTRDPSPASADGGDDLVLGRYRPLETRGAGGSGTVEICWDTRIRRRVAIKRMPLSSRGDGGAVPGLAEARTGAMLSHPNIVSVIDFETTQDEALLIMEAIEGPTLADLIDSAPAGGLDLDVVGHIASSIGSALDFAHENQVLHLDIKPDNILVTRGGIVKVSDFGISELADAQGFGSACGGTIGYMPPEQMRGQDLDQRCDEFSLALVVYEMLTGRDPFMAPTMEASMRLIEGAAPTPPSEFRDDVGPELDDALLRALSPRREDRFETIYDFMGALGGLLGDELAGAAKLRTLVQADDEDGAARRERRSHVDLWNRFGPRTTAFLGRAGAAALCWAVGFLGLSAFGTLDAATCAAAALAIAAAGALKPPLGVLVSLGCLGLGMACNDAFPSEAGLALVAVAILWTIVSRRTRAADANCALAVAPAQLASVAQLAPLLAGYCLPPLRSAIAAGTGACLSVALATVCRAGRAFQTASPAPRTDGSGIAVFQQCIADPGTWIIILTWVISAVLVSCFCSRQTRVSSALGAAAGTAVLFAGEAVALWSQTGSWSAPGTSWTAATLVALLVMIAISALAAPRRDKGED